MNKKILWVTASMVLVIASPLGAQDAPPAPPPAIPSFDPMQPFNPAQPFASQPLTPIQPQQVPMPATPQPAPGASSLPLPEDDEMFDFFQPGYQYVETPDTQPAPEPEPVLEIAPPDDGDRRAKKLPLVRFNYKNQYLPETIYKKQYDRENRHLPRAWYPQDYDAAAFHAAARNDINGLRALINAGRDIEMRNPQGETLAMVATRHGAHATLRYLLAKGADPYGAAPLAIARRDGQAFYAVKTVE